MNIFTELALPAQVRSDLVQVTETIGRICRSSYPSVDAVLRYAASSGGKHLRALLVIVIFRSLAEKTQQDASETKHINLAVAVELMHLATLLHDDVIDDAPMRRGKQSLHAKWGRKDSILAGDLLYATAFEQVVTLAIHHLNADFTDTTKHLITGELLQASLTWQQDHTLQEKQARYLDVIEKKTACLFAFCARAAASLAGESTRHIALWGEYARLLGMAFQVIDDVLDFTSSGSGKAQGTDLKESKVTLPMLLAFPNLSPTDKEMLTNNSVDVAHITDAIKQTNAFTESKGYAHDYCKQAQALCEQLHADTHNQLTSLLARIPSLILERSR